MNLRYSLYTISMRYMLLHSAIHRVTLSSITFGKWDGGEGDVSSSSKVSRIRSLSTMDIFSGVKI